jgi:hypothetical protein
MQISDSRVAGRKCQAECCEPYWIFARIATDRGVLSRSRHLDPPPRDIWPAFPSIRLPLTPRLLESTIDMDMGIQVPHVDLMYSDVVASLGQTADAALSLFTKPNAFSLFPTWRVEPTDLYRLRLQSIPASMNIPTIQR